MTERAKIGLALGGGAALGWAHIGIIRVLQERGWEPDVVAGTSIGSIVGGALVCGKFDTLEHVARAMDWRRMVQLADVQIGKNGFLGGAKVADEFRTHFGDFRIEESKKPFGIVAADLISGEEVIYTSGDMVDAIRASISLPGIFMPVRSGEMLLVDGGLLNTVPVSVCHELGAEKVLAINVTGDYEGQARAAGLFDEEPIETEEEMRIADETVSSETRLDRARKAFREKSLSFFRFRKKEPGLLSVAMASGSMIMREMARAHFDKSPPDVLIEPKVGHFTQIEFDRADELIQAGRDAIEAQIDEVEALFEGRD